MALTSTDTAEILKKHQRAENDTGSPEAQVSILTAKITYLTDHFRTHKKDNHSRRGLLRMVNKRKKLLKYLKSKDTDRYYAIIKALSLRDSY